MRHQAGENHSAVLRAERPFRAAAALRGAREVVAALITTFVLARSAVAQSPDIAPPANVVRAEQAPQQPALSLRPTRQTTFAIPFSWEELKQRPTEVQLYVSANRGINWTLYAREQPETGQFIFRAGGDGEYWFALHTMYEGQSPPAMKELLVGLKVLVDTRPPLLNFSARVGSAGEIVASWDVEDKNLVADTLRIQYQPVVIGGSESTWNDVAIDAASADDEQSSLRGSMKWWPRVPATMINVRAEVRDVAGNVQVITRRIYMPQRNATAASDKPDNPSQELPASSTQGPGELWSADAAGDALAGREKSFTELPPYTPGQEGPAAGDVRPPRVNQFASSSDGGGDMRDSSFRRDSQNGGKIDPNPSHVPAAGHDLRDGIVPRATRSRRFNLSYDVQAVGPEGVAQVTLWATRDGGRSWYEWGTDADRQSPYLVEVDADGTYGFSIVVAGRNGLSGQPPRSGDLADLWVTVDTTKPQARLVAAPFGSGRQTGHLVVRWEADDEQLTDRPITLLFAESAQGPWTPIATGLPNRGEYAWLVDARIPQRIFLRLEVRDKAGNVAIDQLSRPIDLSAMIPRGEIRGFEPVEP